MRRELRWLYPYLLRLGDGREVESVQMAFRGTLRLFEYEGLCDGMRFVRRGRWAFRAI